MHEINSWIVVHDFQWTVNAINGDNGAASVNHGRGISNINKNKEASKKTKNASEHLLGMQMKVECMRVRTQKKHTKS